MKAKIKIYTNPAGLQHDTSPVPKREARETSSSSHPESIARLETVLALLEEEPFSALPVIQCRDTDTDVLLYAHTQDYIDEIMMAVPEQGYIDLHGEVMLSPGTWDAAVSATNTVCRAVDDVISGACIRAFCAVRPPGHHALPDKAMGFCLFNNIFIAARHAQKRYNAKRIVIIDFDVHHGNGTDLMTRQAQDIFYISSHQSPLWPGSGDPQHDEPGKTLNIPLPPGADSAKFRAAYETLVFPAIDAFAPNLMLISAGFDAHAADPLAALNLSEDDYGWVTEKLCSLANKHCDGKIIAALEGGYNLDALKASVKAHLQALAQL